MVLKSGKEEIIYLLEKVIEKFEQVSGTKVIRNSSRKNYEGVAKALSEISNALPETSDILKHDDYPPAYNQKNAGYPFRKYDITGNQVKDAYFNQIVSHPRPFLVDACYIYLFGTGRKGFEENPADENLVERGLTASNTSIPSDVLRSPKNPLAKRSVWSITLIAGLLLTLAAAFFLYNNKSASEHGWQEIRNDMKIMPYKPNKKEIDSLQGIWLCYTASPQARSSDPNRYHMVVSNVVEVKYKNGYFVFNRYGASFDHIGYMQFEAPWIVSIHSYVKNNSDSIESPRHSLMRMDKESKYIPVISASWSFDSGESNNIIGIREVYVKQGPLGTIDEIINTRENASCKCKIVRWHHPGRDVQSYFLRNQLLDSLPDETLKKLLDENSILLRVPQKGLVISKSDSSQVK